MASIVGKKVLGLSLSWGLCVWSLDILPVHVWASSNFLSQSRDMYVRLTSDFKLGMTEQ